MALLFSLVLISLPVVFAQITLESHNIGCLDQTCSKLCKLGVLDCSALIPLCEYGYFLFNQKYCVKCPGANSNMRLECMDCYENPNEWSTWRKCTYSYQILNGNPAGVFQSIQEQPRLYFVVQSTQTYLDLRDREVSLPYDTSLCEGCDSFCDDEKNDKCNFLSEINNVDPQVGVICQNGFYYDTACLQCRDNCKSCTSDECIECFNGYVLSDEGKCQPCQDGCLSCTNGETNKECSECAFSLLESYYVPSLFLNECVSCTGSCIRCEYMTYDTTIYPQYLTRNLDVPFDEDVAKYILRCRQCESQNQFIDNSGETCQDCLITNCQQCFQDLGDGVTTLDADFAPKIGTFGQLCNKCKLGFKLSSDKKSCVTQTAVDNCQTFNLDGTCQQCQNGFMYDSQNAICTNIQCSAKIAQCLDCFTYVEPDTDITYDSDGNAVTSNKQQIQCTKCAPQYYADFFTGSCLKCDSNCAQCQQYTQSYNLTDIGQNYVVYSQSQKATYQNEDIQDLMCIYCSNGYKLYNNVCQGCGDGCLINQQSMCIFDNEGAYCSQCPPGKLSLTSDLSDCADCPQYCLACRERSEDEIDQINPLFNPSNQDFLKYSNLCYKTMDNLDPARNLFLDTVTFMPTACSFPGTSRKCHYTSTINVNLDCGSDDPPADVIDLSLIFKGKGKKAKLLLKTVDTYSNYLLLNKNAVQEITIIVNVLGETCSFSKPTKFLTYLQQNVFSLMKLNIQFKSATNALFSQVGQLEFTNVNNLLFENINFQYNIDSKTKTKDFGIIFSGTSSTFIIKNSKIDKETSLDYAIFSFNFAGVQTLSLYNIEFNQLQQIDPFLIQNFTIESNYRLILDNVKFTECTFVNKKYLFAQNPLDQTNLLINQLTIYKSNFTKTNVFGTSDNSNYPQITLKISGLKIQISSFNSSNIFSSNQIIASSISNVDIYSCQFISSLIFNLNHINFNNFYVALNKFFNSIAFSTTFIVDSSIVPKTALSNFAIINLNFETNDCTNINCLFLMSTPQNAYNIQANLIISSMQISDSASFMNGDEIYYVNSASAYFSSFQQITLNKIKSVSNLGMNVFYFSQIKSIEVDTLLCDFTQDQSTPVYDDEGVEQQIANPFLNRIPASENCADILSYFNNYNFYCMYIDQFSHGVKFNNVVIRNQLLVDFSAVVIQSYDILQQNTSRSIDQSGQFYSNYECEVVIINNFQANNNTLIAYELGSSLSLISIFSGQMQYIEITSVNMQSNHLHKSSRQKMLPSGAIFVVMSQQANMKMSNLVFEYNRATQIEYGLNYFSVKSLTLINGLFQHTNIFDAVWTQVLSEHQMDNIQIWQFFEVKSLGSNIFLQSQQLIIQDAKFIDTFGLDGSGMYIVTQGNGEIQINNAIFQDILTNLAAKYSTQGGALFIDARASSLNLQLSNIQMSNCVTRVKSGCIWVGTSKNSQYILISDSKFDRCQALTSQFIEVQFLDISTQVVELRNVRVSNNSLTTFLSSIPQISDSEIHSFKSTASVYSQTNGQLLMDNVQFTDIEYYNIIYAINLYKGYFNDVQFVDNTIFSAPLLYITVKDEYGILYFGQLLFANNAEYTHQEYIGKCNNLYFSYPNKATQQQSCDNWQDNVQLAMSQFDDDYYIVADLTVSDDYVSLTDQQKYAWSDIGISYQQAYFAKTIDFSYNNDVKKCLFYNLLFEVSNQTTAYIQIQTLREGSQLKVEGLKFNINTCTRCVYGLMQLIDIQKSVSLIQINELYCVNNQISYHGCLVVTSGNELNDIQFNKPLIDDRRILQQETEINYTIAITNSKFYSNRARIGSGMTIFGLHTEMYTCEFSNNVASLVGAGIYFNSVNSVISIFYSLFKGNSAQFGSAIYLEGTQLTNQTKCMNQFESNNGSSTYEDPMSLTIILNDKQFETVQFNNYTNEQGDVISDQIDIIDQIYMPAASFINYPQLTNYFIVPSGQRIQSYKYFYLSTMEQVPYDWRLKLIYLNRFNEIVAGEFSSDQCLIDGRIQNISHYDSQQEYLTNFTNYNSITYNVTTSSFELNELIITFDPYIDESLYLELRFICKSVRKPVIQEEYPYIATSHNDNYQLLLNIRTYPCQLGEVYVDQKCQACDPNQKQFNVVLNAKECKEMNSDNMLDVTPVGVKLQKGWWRPYIDNDQFEQCSHLPADCNGGWIPGNPSCYTGHIGALCESCDLYGQFYDIRYSNTEKYVCSPCADTKDSSIGILIGNTLATVASITLSVKGTYEIVNQFLMIKSLTLMGARINQNANNLATLIKMLTNYFQIIQIMNTFQLVIPKGLTKTTDAAGNPTKSSSFSLDCILQPMTDINMLYFRMIWALVMPCIYLLIYFVQYFFGVLIGKIPYKAAMVSTAFIYMFIFAQPTLVGGFIQLGSSRIVSGVGWVQADVAYRSDESEHQLWVAAFVAPMIVVWVALLPLIFLYRLYTYRFFLTNRHIRSRWGFFYNEYETSAYYWEFVKIFQKELMVIFLTFYEDYVLIKGSLVILVLLYYSWIQTNSKPYSNGDLNYIDRFSTVVCIVTLLIGLLIYTSYQYDTAYLIIIMFVLLGIFNLIFLLSIVMKIFEGYLVKLSDKIDPIRDKINGIKPNLRYQYPSLRKLLRNKKQMSLRVNQLWSVLRRYTKEQIGNRRLELPKYEAINNAPYDFAAAKLPRDASATVVPILDEQLPEYLNSGLANGAKALFNKVNEMDAIGNQKTENQTEDKKKEENKKEGFLNGLKQYMPKSVKDNMEKAEKKIEEAKKMKEQAENAIAKGKQLAGIKEEPKNDAQQKEEMDEEHQNLKENETEVKEKEGSSGLFGSVKSFLPDSVKQELKKAEDKKKQIEKEIEEAKNLKNKLEQTAGQIKDGTIINKIIPEEAQAQIKKIEEEKQKLEQLKQQALQISSKPQEMIANFSPLIKIQAEQFQELNEEEQASGNFQISPMQITTSNFKDFLKNDQPQEQ